MDNEGPKKDAAYRLADAFLDGVYAEKSFDGRLDRGMAVAWVVMSFIVREKISPASYLKWLKRIVRDSVVILDTPEAAAIHNEDLERRRKTWH